MRLTAAVCAVAGTLVLGAGAASAAEGLLIINREAHENPSGCVKLEAGPVEIENSTDKQAYVYQKYGCTGEVTRIIHPGEFTIVIGASVKIG